MPILAIQIVLRPGERVSPEVAGELARRAGEIFGSPPAGTWVKVVPIAAGLYAENTPTPEDVYPVFVSVLKAEMPSEDALRAEVAQLTAAVAKICGRPSENTHVIYLPEGAGRVAFAGDLVSD
jgi:phenylpyruvate tautomerase PptA (4-oxalocrotonate tautomerase family)